MEVVALEPLNMGGGSLSMQNTDDYTTVSSLGQTGIAILP